MRMYLQGQTPSEQLAKPGQIIVATDLSELDILLPHAIAQAKVCGANLTLAHAITGSDTRSFFEADRIAQLVLDARKTIEKAILDVKAEGLICTSQITQAVLPDDFLSQIVRHTGTKRVIMASHGRGRLGQLTLGSVAHQLLSTMDVPIFAVGPKSVSHPEHCYPKKILHPVSFSPGYRESVEFARNIAELHNAELMLMNVLDSDLPDQIDPTRTVQWAKNALDDAILDRTTVTVPLSTHVACGDIVKEVLNTAATFRADWIVLGTTPSAYAPLLASGAAYKLMAATDVPVLTFPHKVRSSASKLEKTEIPAILR